MQTTLMKGFFSTLIALAASLSFSTSADYVYKPAQFGDAVNHLQSEVTLPDSFDGGFSTIAVYCQADVASSGSLGNLLCYEKTNTANLRQQTLDALQGASFVPAQVGSNTLPVRMQFRVVYSRSGEQPDVVMLPNLGSLQSQYGYDYFAPQERLDQKDWYTKYADNVWAQGKNFFNDGRLTRVIGTVKVNGEVASVSTLDARGKGKRDADFIETALKQTKFIPGFVNGQATEMHYVAVLNYAK